MNYKFDKVMTLGIGLVATSILILFSKHSEIIGLLLALYIGKRYIDFAFHVKVLNQWRKEETKSEEELKQEEDNIKRKFPFLSEVGTYRLFWFIMILLFLQFIVVVIGGSIVNIAELIEMIF